MQTTSRGALSASSTTNVRPSFTARTKGESSQEILPSMSEGTKVRV